jgi:hypothetical protein
MSETESQRPVLSGEPSDDLSGQADTSIQITQAANRALADDPRLRALYRTGATLMVVVAVVSLIVAMFCLLNALQRDLTKASAPLVGLLTALILAIAVLSIALLRSTFAPLNDVKLAGPEKDGASATTVALEAVKAGKDVIELVVKGLPTKPS